MGNVCRSPFAAEYARRLAARYGLDLDEASAGIKARADFPPVTAVHVAREFSVELQGHRSRRVDVKLLRDSDLVIVFDGWTWASMFRAFPREIGKVHILGRFTPTPVMDIADPWSGDDEVFRQCYRQISAGIESMLGQFLNSPAPEISTP